MSPRRSRIWVPSERDTCRRQVERILEHFLKLAYAPSAQPRRGWKRSIVEARSVLENKLSATIRRDVEQQLPRLHRSARRAAILALEEYDEAEAARLLPEASPWTLEDVLCDAGIRRRGCRSEAAATLHLGPASTLKTVHTGGT